MAMWSRRHPLGREGGRRRKQGASRHEECGNNLWRGCPIASAVGGGRHLAAGRVDLRSPNGRRVQPKAVRQHGDAPAKVVLAYSGGLDTSIIVRWLMDTYGCEVVTYTADLGQGEEVEPARQKAHELGVSEAIVEDLREKFVCEYVFPMFRANAVYEGSYLLGTSIARPLISKRQVDIAEQCGADAVAHGATGKGNDQVRFELAYYALKPDIKVIAPWREWSLASRSDLVQYARSCGIEVGAGKEQEAPYSTDANLLQTSYEGNALEDPWLPPDESMFERSVSPERAPDQPTRIDIGFEQGNPVSIDDAHMSPAELLDYLNELGGQNGIGRLDIVESRFVGMKSRGVYETPGGTILLNARRAVESLALDREELHLKDDLMPRYAELVYNGFWFAPERKMLQQSIDHASRSVTGTARMKLYKGNASVEGRYCPSGVSLYDANVASFENDQGAYDQQDAEGFIKLQALRLRTLATSSSSQLQADRMH